MKAQQRIKKNAPQAVTMRRRLYPVEKLFGGEREREREREREQKGRQGNNALCREAAQVEGSERRPGGWARK